MKKSFQLAAFSQVLLCHFFLVDALCPPWKERSDTCLMTFFELFINTTIIALIIALIITSHCSQLLGKMPHAARKKSVIHSAVWIKKLHVISLLFCW